MSLLTAIPGLRAAVEQEQLDRDADFLPIPKAVGPFLCRPMTLSDFLLLRIAKCPLLFASPSSPMDLERFFWLLRPEYKVGSTRGRAAFHRHCKRLFYPRKSWALWNTRKSKIRLRLRQQQAMERTIQIRRAAEAFVAHTFEDALDAQNGYKPSYYSEGAAFVMQFPQWPPEVTLRQPIRVLLQLRNAMDDGKRPLVNRRSNEVRAAWLRDQNKNGN